MACFLTDVDLFSLCVFLFVSVSLHLCIFFHFLFIFWSSVLVCPPFASPPPLFPPPSETRFRTSRGILSDTHTLLSSSAVNSILRSNEVSEVFPVKTKTNKSTSVSRFDTSSVASNDPIEDRYAVDSVSPKVLYGGKSSSSSSGDGDDGKNKEEEELEGIKLFSTIDGHSGSATSELLSKVLHPMIVLSLRSLYAGYTPQKDETSTATSTSSAASAIKHIQAYLASARSYLSPSSATNAEINPNTIMDALTSAFLTLDNQITSSPLRLLGHFPAGPGKPNLRPIALPMIDPALSGAVVVSLLVDEMREEVYVAGTGDCRAVAGYWMAEGPEGKKGGWRCEVLTEDCMGDNPKEVER